MERKQAAMNKDLMFSSKTDLWATPQELFDKYDAIYRFETDVCALPSNAKCKRFFTPETDGLQQEWTGSCWCNPPYGRSIGKWVEKAYKASRSTGGGSDGGDVVTSKNRYQMVPRFLFALWENRVSKRPIKIRRLQKPSAVSVNDRGV